MKCVNCGHKKHGKPCMETHKDHTGLRLICHCPGFIPEGKPKAGKALAAPKSQDRRKEE